MENANSSAISQLARSLWQSFRALSYLEVIILSQATAISTKADRDTSSGWQRIAMRSALSEVKFLRAHCFNIFRSISFKPPQKNSSIGLKAASDSKIGCANRAVAILSTLQLTMCVRSDMRRSLGRSPRNPEGSDGAQSGSVLLGISHTRGAVR